MRYFTRKDLPAGQNVDLHWSQGISSVALRKHNQQCLCACICKNVVFFCNLCVFFLNVCEPQCISILESQLSIGIPFTAMT